ncbi:E3 SUMO-protein ligase ZBED1-like [Calliphora vicina]|uniref:E3 SUMO-protein ligase ZBED1-like n=1 Tax=Calliphora vicina TaxID=7373 RepID=UPI00325B9F5B
MSEKRKHSAIWLHFSEDGNKRAKCNYCKTSLSTSGGSHGNLSRHMKSKHPLTQLNLERQASTPISTEILESDVIHVDQPSTSTQIRAQTSQSQSITNFFRKPPPVRKVEQIDKQVLKMVAKGHHALRIVEELEFKKLIEVVSQCPGYTLPTRKTLSNNILPTVYNEILSNVKIQLVTATAVCLTTDGWTSKTNVSYLAVTAHYIDDDTNLKSHLIACDEFGERHTAENLTNYLEKIMSDFEINNKITAVVSDNAANITAAIRQGQWKGIACFAHSLNLIAQAAVAEVGDTMTKIKRIVEYFHRSSQGLKKLIETQKQMQLPELKLKQDVVTRWNSTYDMLQRIVCIKDAVISTLALNRPDLSLPLDEWVLLDEIILILKPFYEVTKEISAEKNVTLSKVTVLCNLLESKISRCNSSNERIIAMSRIIKNGLITRFGELERSQLYAESTILDPRFKRNGFKNVSMYESAVRVLRNQIILIRLQNSETTEESCPEMIASNDEESSIWNEYDYDFNKTVRPENNIAAGIREFDKYLNEEYLDRKKDPLTWWKERKQLYPRVYIYALKRLCIVATSVPCERIFSATGQIINERRTLLKPNKVSSLVFLHNNM